MFCIEKRNGPAENREPRERSRVSESRAGHGNSTRRHDPWGSWRNGGSRRTVHHRRSGQFHIASTLRV